jgi:hypothetical protein
VKLDYLVNINSRSSSRNTRFLRNSRRDRQKSCLVRFFPFEARFRLLVAHSMDGMEDLTRVGHELIARLHCRLG